MQFGKDVSRTIGVYIISFRSFKKLAISTLLAVPPALVTTNRLVPSNLIPQALGIDKSRSHPQYVRYVQKGTRQPESGRELHRAVNFGFRAAGNCIV
jgi:hypothetical protein